MPQKLKKLNDEHYKILELLKAHALDGISELTIEKMLGLDHAQTDRRRRDLNSRYVITARHVKVAGQPRGEWRHFYVGERKVQLDDNPITAKQRAVALGKAKGRCPMCGRTINEDGIKLVVDHKIPREWGGKTEDDNLWAACSECNAGKKNHFESFDPEVMKGFMHHKSIHVRIGELLKTFEGEPAAGDLIEFAANQDDWKKRTRDLRYLGWDVAVSKRKIGTRVKSFYALQSWKEWPPNPTEWVRRYEHARKDDRPAFEAMKREAAAWTAHIFKKK